MHRKFITLIIVVAIAVTGFSAPARAGNNDVAKALAGLAVLAIIGATIHKRNQKKAVISSRSSEPVYRGQKHRRHGNVDPRPMPQQVARTILPRSCLRRFDLGHGEKTKVLARRCMFNTYEHTQNLPRACAERIWSPKGVRRGFNVRCLKQNGYRISRN
ncbi:MAG: hypothetical protein JKY94_02730 [Rhodobacteraceae bacterium]|nr:hypothetical protein [Paracoccaceae bacterium]